jgi:hypothetical protein
MGLLRGHCHLKGHLFKLGTADSPRCNKCRQAHEMASHILCNCEALATLRFKHLGQHFMKLGGHLQQQDTVLFSWCWAAEGTSLRAVQKTIMVEVPAVMYSMLF